MALVRPSARGAAVLILAAAASGVSVGVGAPSLASGPEGSPAPGVSPAPDASPAPGATTTLDELTDRGVHCIECYLLWDPVASREFVKEFSAQAEGAAAAQGEGAATAGEATPSEVGDAHPWLDIELAGTDGSRFALADLSGRPVLVEVMATWCPSCAAQQDVLRDARADLPADTVLVSLDVDPFGSPDALARYAASHGYTWRFAVAPVELSRALAESFGVGVINPAVSPIVVIGRDGGASLAPLGHKDRAAILALVDPAP